MSTDPQYGASRPPAPRPGVGTVLKHLTAMGLMVAGLVLTVWAFLYTSTGQWIDETALSEVSGALIRYSSPSTELLDALPLISGILAVLGIALVLVRRHRFVPALVGLLAAGGANATTQLLKHSLLEKPDLGIQDATLNSLPSGHTTFAAAAGAALFLAAPKRWRPAMAVLMAALAIITGVATVINAWHRPADVVAALFVVGAWTVLGLLILRFLPAEARDTASTRHSGMLLIPLFVIVGLFMAFCAGATYVVAANQHFAGAALLGSLCLIGAVGLLTNAVLVGLLRMGRPASERAYTKVWTY
jgi:membrane-associated phospholipid phosphatase